MKICKMHSKRILAIVMMLLLTVGNTFAAVPGSFTTGTESSERMFFFANGNTITISERPDGEAGALITWGESGEALVGPKTTIFGGSHDDDTPMSTHIIMEGGTVNAIFGGGLHKSYVEEALIEIKAGTINYQVAGGGASSLTNKCGCENATWYAGEPENSPCKVMKSTIIIEDGVTFSSQTTNGYSLLFGGGEGIGYTKETVININGGEFVDTYVTAGGSNGYTGRATLNIASGDFKAVVQGINRGTMDEINMNISGGTFNNLYIGGETLDAGVTGTYEKAIANISGDNIKITKLLPGSNGNSVTDDTSKVEISLGSNVLPENITNKEDAEALFGMSGDFSAFKVLGIELNEESVELTKDDTLTLTATVNAGVAVNDKSVIWESEDTEIATVTDGLITAVGVGETTIIAKSKVDETVFAICTVKVNAKEVPGGNNNNDNNDDDNNDNTEEKWENPFHDIKEDAWYYDSIKYVKQNGIFKGMSATEYGPEISMTRGMAVEVLYRLSKEEVTEKSSFEDVSEDAYYANSVAWALKNGIVEGIGDNKFAPDRDITREEFVTMLYRYAEYKNENVEAEFGLEEYEDSKDISKEAVNAFKWVMKSEIVRGVSDTQIAPKKHATRAEVATMLMRFCN